MKVWRSVGAGTASRPRRCAPPPELPSAPLRYRHRGQRSTRGTPGPAVRTAGGHAGELAHACTRMHTHAHTCTRVHMRAHGCTSIYMQPTRIHIQPTRIRTHPHTSTAMHMQPHTSTCVHTHAHTPTCLHTHSHACTHTHTHAHTPTPMHMHARGHPRPVQAHAGPGHAWARVGCAVTASLTQGTHRDLHTHGECHTQCTHSSRAARAQHHEGMAAGSGQDVCNECDHGAGVSVCAHTCGCCMFPCTCVLQHMTVYAHVCAHLHMSIYTCVCPCAHISAVSVPQPRVCSHTRMQPPEPTRMSTHVRAHVCRGT